MNSDHKSNQNLQKAVAIVGPTASGKTRWSLNLAKRFNGEIISADSRQIYKKMDIGTAKEIGEWRWNGLRKTYFIEDVPHHLVDFLDPGKTFSVAEFKDKAIKYVKMAHKNGRVPFIVGGTGLYLHALIDNLQIPHIQANNKLRASLEVRENDELFTLLAKLDPKTAESVDRQNKRRLIRALEVCILTGSPFSEQQLKGEPMFNILQIGINLTREEIYRRLELRVEKMISAGLEKEVKGLLKQKYNWQLPSMSGIGYREFKDYLEGKCNLEELKENLKKDNRNYAKRQVTWFKRDKRIIWCDSYEEAERVVGRFLKD